MENDDRTNAVRLESGGSIFFTTANGERHEAASGFEGITATAVSADPWRLFIADSGSGCVYSMSINKNGDLTDRKLFASLYQLTDFTYPNATSLAVDSCDRIYAATEMGVQVIRSFGIIEAILSLPDDRIPEKLAFGGENNGYLYVQCKNGVYKRQTVTPGRPPEASLSKPVTRSYYKQ